MDNRELIALGVFVVVFLVGGGILLGLLMIGRPLKECLVAMWVVPLGVAGLGYIVFGIGAFVRWLVGGP